MYLVIGLHGMDHIQGDILFRSGRFVRSFSVHRCSLLPLTATIAGNHRLFTSLHARPPISSKDKFQIPRSYFWSSLLYRGTQSRRRWSIRENEVYTSCEPKTRCSIDPSPAVGYESQMPSIKNEFGGLSDACSIDTGFSVKMFKTICYSR